jgi:hypothetical protein
LEEYARFYTSRTIPSKPTNSRDGLFFEVIDYFIDKEVGFKKKEEAFLRILFLLFRRVTMNKVTTIMVALFIERGL